MAHTPSWKTLPVAGVSIWSKGLAQPHGNQASPPTRGRTERGHVLRPETDGWDPGAPSALWAGILLLRGGAPRVRRARRGWPAAGLPRPGPRRFSVAASGCLCFAASREPRRRRREEGSGRRRRRPRREAPGHRRLRRPPSPPSRSRAAPSRPPRSRSFPLPASPPRSPALPAAPRLLRPAPCGAAAAGGSSCPRCGLGGARATFAPAASAGPRLWPGCHGSAGGGRRPPALPRAVAAPAAAAARGRPARRRRRRRPPR